MLFYLLLIVIVMTVFAVAIMKMTFWMISRMGHKYIEQLHRSAEFIINTGKIPPFWRKEGRTPSFPLMDKYLILKKLKKTITYFENNIVAGDDESRQLVVTRLSERYNEWVDLDWVNERPAI